MTPLFLPIVVWHQGGESGNETSGSRLRWKEQPRNSYVLHEVHTHFPQSIDNPVEDVPDARPLNPDMPYGPRDFGGKWRFAMHDLGADIDGNVINNKWENKGQFIAWFKYYVRPLHYEFAEAFVHKREQFCVPEINTCAADPGYPTQNYDSCLPQCPLPLDWPEMLGVPSYRDPGPGEPGYICRLRTPRWKTRP